MTIERDKQAVRAEFLEKSVPEKRRVMVERAFSKTLSPRAAIKANCFVCCGMDASAAAACSVVLCPLYEYNGYRKAEDGELLPEEDEKSEN